MIPPRLRVVDSHTLGEPTRVVFDEVIAATLELPSGPVRDRREAFRQRHDDLRRALVGDPRGTDALVGVFLLPPFDPACTLAAIFVNRVGYLDMCGHATIGLAVTLGATGRIAPGPFRLETPAGAVTVTWHGGAEASFENVPPRRTHRGMTLDCGDGTIVTGDVATAGLWFFLTADHGLPIVPAAVAALTARAWAIRRGLEARGITGSGGEPIDHVVLLGPPAAAGNDGRSFVLCPDGSFDRSPCGTATSALVACLHEDGRLDAGRTWRQESILGGVYEASVRRVGDMLVPTVRGRAWISGVGELCFDPDDPYRMGLPR